MVMKDMNKKLNIWMTRIGIMLLLCISVILILAGADGKALKEKQSVFIYHISQKVSRDPSTYFYGVTDSSRVKMDFSKVREDQVGIYQVKAKQSSRHYTFKIEITK